MVYFWRSSYATFVRNWTVVFHAYPWSFFISGVFSGICSALLAFFAYHLLADNHIGQDFTRYTGTADYMSYLILGASILSFSIRILLGISRSLITERREGTLESLLLAPSPRLYYFTGITGQWIVNCVLETAFLMLLVWPLGLNMSHCNLVTLVVAFPVAVLALFGVSVLLGACMLATGDTYVLQNTLFAALTLLCGFVFPIAYLPQPLQWVAQALPVTGAVQLLREALLNGFTLTAVVPDLLRTVALGLGYALLGMLLMRWAERRALEGAY
ncbi:ABC transporter permease [Dictyobacter kobayashii]|uniref:Transport permease protein n=1 Tax=Dictyobacter kobayashii TaxID=2014872 RepID=A0A402AX76_9CHLR|nr:ABC transporter permease [Dictyobacter kobayashii]GCE23732.1 ABC transporter [Dictyobacter kobayashii]